MSLLVLLLLLKMQRKGPSEGLILHIGFPHTTLSGTADLLIYYQWLPFPTVSGYPLPNRSLVPCATSSLLTKGVIKSLRKQLLGPLSDTEWPLITRLRQEGEEMVMVL